MELRGLVMSGTPHDNNLIFTGNSSISSEPLLLLHGGARWSGLTNECIPHPITKPSNAGSVFWGNVINVLCPFVQCSPGAHSLDPALYQRKFPVSNPLPVRLLCLTSIDARGMDIIRLHACWSPGVVSMEDSTGQNLAYQGSKWEENHSRSNFLKTLSKTKAPVPLWHIICHTFRRDWPACWSEWLKKYRATSWYKRMCGKTPLQLNPSSSLVPFY